MFTPLTDKQIEQRYELARESYAALGTDTEAQLQRLERIAVSLHCWQGDDVAGFEVKEGAVSGGGILATGNYPGRARNGDELRADAEKALSLIPGKGRFSLHAIYAETGSKPVPRDELEPRHFQRWMDWARSQGLRLDFNPTYFAHPLADSGYTLSSANDTVRAFWIRHGIACRRIAEAMGRAQASSAVINHWVPDGAKDSPIDRWGPRRRLADSLDQILAAEADARLCKDAVEAKLFGIGSEDYVVGSHEFYMGYALTRKPMLCLDMGHFHPTETIHDKLSAILQFKPEVLLHVSRGIRWDSDHVVILNDDLRQVFHELARGDALARTHVALDYFDASMNRVGAWVIGTRAAKKAILYALLEPTVTLQALENAGDLAGKLGLLEELKTMPFGAVWDCFCLRQGVPVGGAWLRELQAYDAGVIRRR